MKQLPEIGSTVKVFTGHTVNIVAHYQDKAIYVYTSDNGFTRVDLGVANWFSEIEPIKPEQKGCPSGEHNYVQVHEAHSNKAFCTRCGSTISLE